MNLEAFVHTAELRSFTAAARRLGVSVPAVSKAIARMEAELGVPLLTRTSRRVGLTPEGELWLTHCRTAVHALQFGRDQLQLARDQVEGPVRITASPVLGAFMGKTLGRLLDRHPALQLQCSFTDTTLSVASGEVDLAVRVGPLDDSGLRARKLTTLIRTTVASPTYLEHAAPLTHPDDLAAHRCLVFLGTNGRITPWFFRGAPLRPPRVLALGSGNAMVAAAVAGVGVTQAFAFMTREATATGALQPVLAKWVGEGLPVHLLWKHGSASTRRQRVVIDHLIETFPQL